MQKKEDLIIDDLKNEISQGLRSGIPKENNLNIVACLDQSDSVTQINFAFIKMCLQNFISSFNFASDFSTSEVVFGIQVFSDSDKTEFIEELTNEKSSLLEKLKNFKYQGGGTETGLALRQTIAELKSKESERKNSSNIILLFTDDDLAPGKDEILQLAKMENYKLVIIFMGFKFDHKIYNEYNLSQSEVVFFPDYYTMEKVFSLIQEESQKDPPQFTNFVNGSGFFEIEFCIEYEKSYQEEIEIVEFELESLKTGVKEIFNFVNDRNSFKISGLEKYFNHVIEFRYRCFKRNGISTKWTTECSFKNENKFTGGWIKAAMEDELGDIGKSFQLNNNVFKDEKFTPFYQKLVNLKKPERHQERDIGPVNIFLFGIVGAGKSSLINTLESSYSNKYVCRSAVGSLESRTFTKEIERVNIGNSSVINMYDSFGIEPLDYNKKLTFENSIYRNCLGDILNGNVGPEFHLDKSSEPQTDPNRIASDKIGINNKIHSLCLIIDMVSSQDREYCENILTFLEAIEKHSPENCNYTPLIVLTKPDIILNEELKGQNINVSNISTQAMMSEYFHYFTNYIDSFIENMNRKINKSNIFLFPNYIGPYGDESKRDFHKEYLGFTLINQLYDLGLDFIDNYFKNDIKIVLDEFAFKKEKKINYSLGYHQFNEEKLMTNLDIMRYDFIGILKNDALFLKAIGDQNINNFRFYSHSKNEPIFKGDENKIKLETIVRSGQPSIVEITLKLNILEQEDEEECKEDPQKPKIPEYEPKTNNFVLISFKEKLNQDQFELQLSADQLNTSSDLSQIRAELEEEAEKYLSEYVFIDKNNTHIELETENKIKFEDIVSEEGQVILIQKPAETSSQKKIVVIISKKGDERRVNSSINPEENLVALRLSLAKSRINDNFLFHEKDGIYFNEISLEDEKNYKINDLIYELDNNKCIQLKNVE